jgi:hypothetical protein
MSVIAIAYLYPRLKSFLGQGPPGLKIIGFLREGLLVSFAAWLGTVGLVAYYFKIFSSVTVLANIFIVPLATLITLCGFCLVMASLTLTPLAPLFAAVCELTVGLLLGLNAFLIQLPGAYIRLP